MGDPAEENDRTSTDTLSGGDEGTQGGGEEVEGAVMPDELVKVRWISKAICEGGRR